MNEEGKEEEGKNVENRKGKEFGEKKGKENTSSEFWNSFTL